MSKATSEQTEKPYPVLNFERVMTWRGNDYRAYRARVANGWILNQWMPRSVVTSVFIDDPNHDWV